MPSFSVNKSTGQLGGVSLAIMLLFEQQLVSSIRSTRCGCSSRIQRRSEAAFRVNSTFGIVYCGP